MEDNDSRKLETIGSPLNGRYLLYIAILFLLVRSATIYVYCHNRTYYFYGMVARQFAVAEGVYNGHPVSQDDTLDYNVRLDAAQKNQYIPIEEWKNYHKSGRYSRFPALDLPGYGNIIAFTSELFGSELTSKFAFAFQIAVELASILIFVYCVSLVFGTGIAITSGILYIFVYPFIWPIASLPMRDIFSMGILAFTTAALILFNYKKGALSFFISFALILISASLVWIRPSGYYFFFIMAPLVFFAKNRTIKAKLAIILVLIIVPMSVFGIPFKKFNMRYYGVANTHALGGNIWGSMGSVKNNPYGFVCNDGEIYKWVLSQGRKVPFGSPEMNKALSDYAFSIIRKDPAYYLKSVIANLKFMLRYPLELITPYDFVGLKDSGLPLWKFALKYPLNFIFIIANIFYCRGFFYLGLLISLPMITASVKNRYETIVLLSPVFYTILIEIPLHHEARYMCAAAWVLVLPIAWLLFSAIKKWTPLFKKSRIDL